MSNRFEHKVVIVTGAAGGIGSAAARRFAEEGAAVVCVDFDGPGAEAIAAELPDGKAIAVQADVSDSVAVAAYVQAAVDAFGTVDVLFNNAGTEGVVAPLEQYPEDRFDQVLAVNVRGVWLGMKHVADTMRRGRGGVIINTASVAGLGGTPNLVAYGASKHAVVGMTKTGAIELAPAGIRVNAVCPSPIETRMMRSIESGISPDDPESIHKGLADTIPLGRYGEPEEVVALVAFLASDDAGYITGGIYPIDGGRRAR